MVTVGFAESATGRFFSEKNTPQIFLRQNVPHHQKQQHFLSLYVDSQVTLGNHCSLHDVYV